jgi:BON domain
MSTSQRSNRVEIRRIVVTETFSISAVLLDEAPENADLADRVRSQIGPLVKELDLPRIHVMAEGRRVLLHGEVATESDAVTLEDAVASLAGVESVESHLHVGLLPGDTRPSDAIPEPSPMMAALLAAGEAIGLQAQAAEAAVWGAITAVLEQIPADERRHLIAHFPFDVAMMIKPRRRFGDEDLHWDTEVELHAAAALRGGIGLDDAKALLPRVIGVLREFVPEEDVDVQATLRTYLRELWRTVG